MRTPNQLLTREQTAAALRAAGFPITKATLATKATRGNGPRFRRFGLKPLYLWSDALDWAQSRLSLAISNTSEADARSYDLTADGQGGVHVR
jgi:hypothetical protein